MLLKVLDSETTNTSIFFEIAKYLPTDHKAEPVDGS